MQVDEFESLLSSEDVLVEDTLEVLTDLRLLPSTMDAQLFLETISSQSGQENTYLSLASRLVRWMSQLAAEVGEAQIPDPRDFESEDELLEWISYNQGAPFRSHLEKGSLRLRCHVLDYLGTEIQGLQILSSQVSDAEKCVEVHVDELEDTDTSRFIFALDLLSSSLMQLNKNLDFDEDIPSPVDCIRKSLEVYKNILDLNPLFHRESLTESQESMLYRIASLLARDYSLRRAMILKRLDVLLLTFLDAGLPEDVSSRVQERRSYLCSDVCVDLEELYQLRSIHRLLPSCTTRENNRRLNSSVKSLRIGTVPDRGGRQSLSSESSSLSLKRAKKPVQFKSRIETGSASHSSTPSSQDSGSFPRNQRRGGGRRGGRADHGGQRGGWSQASQSLQQEQHRFGHDYGSASSASSSDYVPENYREIDNSHGNRRGRRNNRR